MSKAIVEAENRLRVETIKILEAFYADTSSDKVGQVATWVDNSFSKVGNKAEKVESLLLSVRPKSFAVRAV